MDLDRNLLFGVLAVEFDQITSAQFVHAAEVWAADPSKGLPAYLVDDGAISEGDREFIDDLVEKALHKSGGDTAAALQNMGGEEAVRIASGGSIKLMTSRGIRVETHVEEPHVVAVPKTEGHREPAPDVAPREMESFAWRYMGFVATAAILLVALAGYFYSRILRERDDAILARNLAVEARSAADEGRESAEQWQRLDQQARLVAEEGRKVAERRRDLEQKQKNMALDALTQLTSDIPNRFIDVPGTHSFLREFLEQNAATLDRIREFEPDSVELRRDREANYTLMGSLWLLLGDAPKSIEAYENALAIARRFAEFGPERDRLERTLARQYKDLGVAHSDAAADHEAAAPFETSLEFSRILLEAHPEDIALRQDATATCNLAGNAYLARGARAEALTAFATSLEFNRTVLEAIAEDPATERDPARGDTPGTYENTVKRLQATLDAETDDSELNRALASAYDNLGVARGLHGGAQATQAAFDRSLETYRALSPADSGDPEIDGALARVFNHRALVYSLHEDDEESRVAHRHCLEIAQALLAADPGNAALRQDFASYAFSFGRLHLRLNDFENALAVFKQMIEAYKHPSARDAVAPTATDSLYPRYAAALRKLTAAGRTAETLSLQEAHVSLLQYFAKLDPENLEGLSALAREYEKFGVSLRRANRTDRARTAFQAALDILENLALRSPQDLDVRNQIEPIRRRLTRIDEGR